MTVDIQEAKITWSQLVDAVESGRELEIVITRNGKPATRLVAIARAQEGQDRVA